MKKEKINRIAQIITIAALFVVAYFIFSDETETQKHLYKVGFGLCIAFLISIVVWIITNFKLVWYAVQTNLPWLFFKPIRITVAYLFRIELDGKYLLVRNRRNVPGFQPVGGVYKYLRRENAEFFDKIGLIPDTKIPRDIIAENDLRMQLTKRYKLLEFIHWFSKKKNRELDPWREFYEELVKPGILSQKNFPHIQYRFIKQHKQLKYSEHHKVKEYKVADVYELQISTEAQKEELRKLIKSGHEDIIFATAADIKNKLSDKNIITEHTYKII